MAASFAACGNAAPAVQSPESAPTVESSVSESSVSEATTAPETTEAPVATEKPTASPEATPEPTTAPTAAPTVEPTPVPTEEPKDAYTFTDMSATMYAKSSVNVRDLPSTDGSKVGSLNTNSEVAVTGKCNETGWYRFAMNGQDAYVSGNYLQSSKVQVATQVTPTQSTSGGAPATQQGGSTPSGSSSADAGNAGGNGSQGSSSDVSWELIADVEGGKIYQGSDGSQMSVSDSGVVDVTPAENIGGGDGFDWNNSEEDDELFQQWQDAVNQNNGG